ncbi:MAG: hypothetical protein ACOCQA_02295 [bacterium]
MYCAQCSSKLSPETEICSSCGAVINKNKSGENKLLGYSSKINDTAFSKYLSNTKKWSIYFTVFLAVIAVVGFFIYGEVGSAMDNPEALFIGLGIGSLFVIISIVQLMKRKRSKTWDGKVIDKKIKKKRYSGDPDDGYYQKEVSIYTVIIQDDRGKKHKISVRDDDTIYNYYNIGDRVRHHAGLDTYEKYDKTGDTIILCSACGMANDINSDYCSRCKCPLLK